MASIEEIGRRLANHANLPGNGEINDSLLGQLWLAGRNRTYPRFDAFQDVMECLKQLNFHFNGPDPNARLPGPPPQVPLEISYPIAVIIQRGLQTWRDWTIRKLFPEDILEALIKEIARIAHCWEEFLASDTTDLEEGFTW